MDTPKPAKPEEQVITAELDSASDNVDQKPFVSASLGQAVGDEVQAVLDEDPRIAEEWKKRRFLIVNDDLQVCAALSNGLRQKGVEDSRIIAVSDRWLAIQAVDQFLSKAQAGECLTLFCSTHLRGMTALNCLACTSMLRYVTYFFENWRTLHPNETNPPGLEIIITGLYKITFKDEDEKKSSDTGAPLVVGVCPKEEDCLDVFQGYLKGEEQNFTRHNMNSFISD